MRRKELQRLVDQAVEGAYRSVSGFISNVPDDGGVVASVNLRGGRHRVVIY